MLFEWTGNTSSMQKYYNDGATRVAMRRGTSFLYWLLGDHLGSQAITANASGEKISEVRYSPWGEDRYYAYTSSTTFRYTGQRTEFGLGLMYYGARWYDPAAGRFIQPDSIIPNAGNSQAFDRYAYSYNNPINYIDPTGYATCEDMPWECDAYGNWLDNGPAISFTSSTLVEFTNCSTCSWTNGEISTITYAVTQEAIKYADILNSIIQQENKRMPLYGEDSIPLFTPAEAFLLIRGGPVNFERTSETCASYFNNSSFTCWGSSISPTHVIVFSNAPASGVASQPQFATHELGHGFDQIIDLQGRSNIPYITENEVINARKNYLDNGVWQQSGENNAWELFADTYIAWVYGHYRQGYSLGNPLEGYMTTNMVNWLTNIVAKGGR